MEKTENEEKMGLAFWGWAVGMPFLRILPAVTTTIYRINFSSSL